MNETRYEELKEIAVEHKEEENRNLWKTVNSFGSQIGEIVKMYSEFKDLNQKLLQKKQSEQAVDEKDKQIVECAQEKKI